MDVRIISVDFQRDFSAKGGKHFRERPSTRFVKRTLVPYLRKKSIKLAEIISDYRQPRPGDGGTGCAPGTWGYESEIPDDVKLPQRWIKCMNSPLWVRKHGGDPARKPGLPYQDPAGFSQWLEKTIGKPDPQKIVVLVGLTQDCCILCTAQELRFRGHQVRILKEGTDPYSGSSKEKEMLFANPPLTNWMRPITWKELKKLI